MSCKLLYLLFLATLCLVWAAAEPTCPMHQEYSAKPRCIKTCSGEERCHPGCVCKKGLVYNVEQGACCPPAECPHRMRRNAHHERPHQIHGHSNIVIIDQKSKVKMLGSSLYAKLLRFPLIPIRVVRTGADVTVRVVTFIPKKIVVVLEDGANKGLEASERFIDYIRYNVVLSGHTVGELWAHMKEKTGKVLHENKEVLDSMARSILHVENQVHEKVYGVARSILPDLRVLPSYVKKSDYNKFLSKTHFIGSIMKVGQEGTLEREKAKQKIVHATQLRKELLHHLKLKTKHEIEEQSAALDENKEKLKNLIKGNMHKHHKVKSNLRKQINEVSKELKTENNPAEGA